MDRNLKLSTHLTLGEMVSTNDHGEPSAQQIANLGKFATDIHEPLRLMEGGQGISYTSGWRSVEHNQAVGGAAHSEHLDGIAGDAQTGDLDHQIRRAADASKIPAVGGIGVYPYKGIIHLDHRPRIAGKITSWQQNMDGSYSPLSPAIRMAIIEAGGIHL